MKTLNLQLYDKADNTLRISVVDCNGDPEDLGGVNTLRVYEYPSSVHFLSVALTFDGTYYNGTILKTELLRALEYHFEWRNEGAKVTYPIKGKMAVNSVYIESAIVITGEVEI